MIKCHCNASCESNNCYYSFVIEKSGNEYSDVIKTKKGRFSNKKTKAELRSLEIIIDTIDKKFDNSQIILYSSCKRAIEALNEDIPFEREDLRIISNRIKKIKKRKNNNYKINQIKRNENKAADRLANKTRTPNNSDKSFEKCKNMFFLDRMLNKDISHKVPKRNFLE